MWIWVYRQDLNVERDVEIDIEENVELDRQ